MNKQEYLRELERRLSSLSATERADILRDVEEHFREGMLRGRSEEEISRQLGSPRKFSEAFIAESRIKDINTAPSVSKKFYAVLVALVAIMVLTPFNLIFIGIPLLLITLFFIIGWPIVLVLAITLPFVWMINIFMSFFIGFNIFALLALFFFAIGWCGFVIAIGMVLSYLTVLYFRAIAAILMWNINFVKNRIRG
jgi:uncharacterized membrane protein